MWPVPKGIVMRKVLACTLAFIFAPAFVLNTANPQERKGRMPPDEIEKIVKQLGTDRAKTREAATKELLRIGEDALPHLEVAIAGAENLESKRRAQGLYEEIYAKAPSPKLPNGVIWLKLPPGTVSIENTLKDGVPVLRLSVGKTVLEAPTLFLGDRFGATKYEATNTTTLRDLGYIARIWQTMPI